MTDEPFVDSCNLVIAATCVTLNGNPICRAGPIETFHSLLGEPTRIVPAGPPAPVGHRNNQIHFYDHLGLTLNEHHYTYQIHSITAILNAIDAIHPTTQPFRGTLQIGDVHITAGGTEADLKESSIEFQSWLAGVWTADVLSAPINGHRINVSIDTKGRKLPSGRRSKHREILSVSLSLEHDPWETTYRSGPA